jgi:hypothetical protein
MIDMYQQLSMEPSDSPRHKAERIVSPVTIALLQQKLEWIASFSDVVRLEVQSSPGLTEKLTRKLGLLDDRHKRARHLLEGVIDLADETVPY